MPNQKLPDISHHCRRKSGWALILTPEGVNIIAEEGHGAMCNEAQSSMAYTDLQYSEAVLIL